MNRKPKIIIDCDPGHDDALAIMLLEKSKQFDIVAVTTVAGNSTIENTTNNARYILDLLGSNVPLYSGESKPLRRNLIQAVVHGESGLDGAVITKKVIIDNTAVKKISKLIRKYPNEITLLVIGPQTNIAKVIINNPDLIPLIKQIVIMGGAINVPGNKNRVAEFNIFVDPDAAKIVFETPIKKVLIPLDVCNDIYLTMQEFQQLKGSDVYEQVMAMMAKYIDGIQAFEKFAGALMYDPLAAYYLLNPQAYHLEEMDIKIETESDLTRGMTVADKRNYADKVFNVSVITKINADEFKKDFINTLKN